MEMIPVNSKNIESVGYNAMTSTLEIKFHAGHLYRYFSVPQETYHALLSAQSHSSFFNEQIKYAYQYIKLC